MTRENPRGLPAREYLAKVEADPVRAAALKRARERMGTTRADATMSQDQPPIGDGEMLEICDAEVARRNAAGAEPASDRLRHKPAVQRIMDLARRFRSAPADLYDEAYKAVEQAAYEALENASKRQES